MPSTGHLITASLLTLTFFVDLWLRPPETSGTDEAKFQGILESALDRHGHQQSSTARSCWSTPES